LIIVVSGVNIILNCCGNFKFVSFPFHSCPLFFLCPPTPSFFIRVRRVATHIQIELVPASVLQVDFIADLVPEAPVIGHIGMLPAALVLGALWAILVNRPLWLSRDLLRLLRLRLPPPDLLLCPLRPPLDESLSDWTTKADSS
jgi:hypothetical protein